MPPPESEPVTAGQSWDPEQYQKHAGFVPALGQPVLELLAPQRGERILDLGCGDGVLTVKLAAIADVVGIDASAEQIEAAKARGLDARVMSGEALDFDTEFDAVFSNAALHWMRRPDAAIRGVARALKPGGRFVGEMGGAGNIQAIAGALLAELDSRGLDGRAVWPWYYPGVEEYREKLEAVGFTVGSIQLIDRPTPLPGRMAAWVETFCGPFLALVPPADHPALLDAIEARLASKLRDADGKWTADYVRLRFAAVKQ